MSAFADAIRNLPVLGAAGVDAPIVKEPKRAKPEKGKATAEKRHKDRVAALGCLVCRRFGMGQTPAQLHHVAEGSGKRSDFMVAPLCQEHHQGKSGLHGMSPPAFCKAYRVPNENEYGLLGWVFEDLARAG